MTCSILIAACIFISGTPAPVIYTGPGGEVICIETVPNTDMCIVPQGIQHKRMYCARHCPKPNEEKPTS